MNKYKKSLYTIIINEKGHHYIYNALTGYFGEADEETYRFITNIENNESPEKNEYFNFLRQKNIIVPKSVNEFNQYLLNSRTEQFNANQQNLNFVITTTRKCNYSCKYCFENKPDDLCSMNYEIQNATARFIIESIKDSSFCKNLHITWFGGEPLLNIECIRNISEKLILYCDSKGIRYSADIITNGSLLTPDNIKELTDYKIRMMQITLDGYKDIYCEYKGTTSDNYRRVIENIITLPGHIRLLIRFNLDENNYKSIKDMASYLIQRMSDERKNNTVFYLAPIENEDCLAIGNDSLNANMYDFLAYLARKDLKGSMLGNLPQPRFVSCGALKRGNYCIDADGSLLKCEHCVGDKGKACGNVFDGPDFSDNEEIFYKEIIKNECKSCACFPVCRGGCAYHNRIKGLNIDCNSFKNRLKQTLTQIAKVF